MKNALIIFGGVSSEHDVSCVSAKATSQNYNFGPGMNQKVLEVLDL